MKRRGSQLAALLSRELRLEPSSYGWGAMAAGPDMRQPWACARGAATAARRSQEALEGAGAQEVPGSRRSRAAAASASKPLAPKTRALLQREHLVASFAAQLGMPVEGAAPDSFSGQQAPGEPGEDSATAPLAPPPAAWPLRSQAEELQEKRESRWKKRPPEYPSYEVFDAWLAANTERLQPLREYIDSELGVPPDPIITSLFRKGPSAQAMMMPDWPDFAAAELEAGEEAGEEGEGQAKKKKKKKKKEEKEAAGAAVAKGKAKGKGRKKKGQEAAEDVAAEAELGSADPALETGAAAGELAAAGGSAQQDPPDPPPPPPQQQQEQQQQGQPQRRLPRLAAVVADWQWVLEAAQLPVGPFGRLAALCPALLVHRPPGGREETVARLKKIEGLLHLGPGELARFVNSAPQVLFASTSDVVRRLEFLRLHAHVAEQEVQAALHRAPGLLWMQEDRLTESVRCLVSYCRTAGAYAALVRWHPELLLQATKRRAAAALGVLKGLLPEGFAPEEVLKARPQLLLNRPRHLVRNWQALLDVCAQVPSWQDDLDQVLEVPPPAQQAQQAQQGDAAAAAHSDPGSPEQLLADAEEGGAPLAAGGKQGRKGKKGPPSGPRRQQYHSLGRLLDLRPEQLERLRFILEAHPSAAVAGGEPLEELVTMRPRTFERIFPGMADWQAAAAERRRQEQEAAAAVGLEGSGAAGAAGAEEGRGEGAVSSEEEEGEQEGLFVAAAERAVELGAQPGGQLHESPLDPGVWGSLREEEMGVTAGATSAKKSSSGGSSSTIDSSSSGGGGSDREEGSAANPPAGAPAARPRRARGASRAAAAAGEEGEEAAPVRSSKAQSRERRAERGHERSERWRSSKRGEQSSSSSRAGSGGSGGEENEHSYKHKVEAEVGDWWDRWDSPGESK